MTDDNQQPMDLSFRDRSDREKIESLTEKYGPDTNIGRLARNVLEAMPGADGEGGGGQ